MNDPTKDDQPHEVIDPLTGDEFTDSDEDAPIELEEREADEWDDDEEPELEPDYDEEPEFEPDDEESEFEPDYEESDFGPGPEPRLAPGPKHGPGHHPEPPHEHGPGPKKRPGKKAAKKAPGKKVPGKKVPGKKAAGKKHHPGHPPPPPHEHGPDEEWVREPDFRIGPGTDFSFGPGPAFSFGFGPAGSRRHRRGPGPGRRRRRGRPGDIRAAILSLLAERPMHGYEMIQEIAEHTQDLWRPSPGSVYPTLQLLSDEGLIVGSESEGSKKLFELTDEGRAAAGKVKTPPWEGVAEDVDSVQADLRTVLGQVVGAVAQAAYAATTEQQQRVVAILKKVRREIYTLLAESE